jgi:hypothetical protein
MVLQPSNWEIVVYAEIFLWRISWTSQSARKVGFPLAFQFYAISVLVIQQVGPQTNNPSLAQSRAHH